jgi:hypothetical protein
MRPPLVRVGPKPNLTRQRVAAGSSRVSKRSMGRAGNAIPKRGIEDRISHVGIAEPQTASQGR